MTRLYLELAGAAAAIIAIAWLWIHHDNHEQTQGAQACIQGTTESKAVGELNAEHVEQATQIDLQKVVDSYDAKLSTMRAANGDLAQRLHDSNQVHTRTVPGISQPAGSVCAAADDGRPSERDRREAADLEACAANTLELMQIRQAWADAAKKKAPVTAP